MKPLAYPLVSILSVLLSMTTPAPALADDETDDTSIVLQAPIEATSCDSVPQTITVLGTVVDITNVLFDGGSATDCATLEVGRTAELQLGSDAAPLVAATLHDSGTSNTSVQGPIQAVDAVAQTIQVLGLSVSTVGAELEGSDDDSSDGIKTPIDATSLVVGQTVSIELDESVLPALVARKLEMKNFANQVEIEIDDTDGVPIEDASDDISIDATASTVVTSPAGTKTIKKNTHLHASSNGHFTLSGVPTGKLRVTVTRNANGASRRKNGRASVVGNSTVPVVVHLRTN